MARSDIVRLTNVDAFNDSLMRIASNSRAPVKKTMEKQTRLILAKIFTVMPPAGRASGKAAKARGMKAVESQIGKVMQGVEGRGKSIQAVRARAVSESNMRKWHEKHRKQGVVKRSLGRKKLKVSKGKLKSYIAKRKKSVGMLSGGFNVAARKFELKSGWPSWIKRHSNAPGSASFKVKTTSFRIRFTNKVKYVRDVSVSVKRLDWALQRQAKANKLLLNDYKKTAIKEGFKVR